MKRTVFFSKSKIKKLTKINRKAMSSSVLSQERLDQIASTFPESSKEVAGLMSKVLTNPEEAVEWFLKQSQENSDFATFLSSLVKPSVPLSPISANGGGSSRFISELQSSSAQSPYACRVDTAMPFLDTTTYAPSEDIQRTYEVTNIGDTAFPTGLYLVDDSGVCVFKSSHEVPPKGVLYVDLRLVAPATPGKHTCNFLLFDDKKRVMGAPFAAVLNVCDKTKAGRSIGASGFAGKSRRLRSIPKGTFSGVFSVSKAPLSTVKMAPFAPQQDPVQQHQQPPQPPSLPPAPYNSYQNYQQTTANAAMYTCNMTLGYSGYPQQQPPYPYQQIPPGQNQYMPPMPPSQSYYQQQQPPPMPAGSPN